MYAHSEQPTNFILFEMNRQREKKIYQIGNTKVYNYKLKSKILARRWFSFRVVYHCVRRVDYRITLCELIIEVRYDDRRTKEANLYI